MSVIVAEELRAGIILGDNENKEYIYMPGSEIGSENPMCIFESKGTKSDLHIRDAVEMAKKLTLKPVTHPTLGKRSY